MSFHDDPSRGRVMQKALKAKHVGECWRERQRPREGLHGMLVLATAHGAKEMCDKALRLGGTERPRGRRTWETLHTYTSTSRGEGANLLLEVLQLRRDMRGSTVACSAELRNG